MRGRDEMQFVVMMHKMEGLEDGLRELQFINRQLRQEHETKVANRHFWMAIFVPATIGLITTGATVAVTIIFKK